MADPSNPKLVRRPYGLPAQPTPFIRENVRTIDEAVLNRKPFGQLVHDAPNTAIHPQALNVATENKEIMSTPDNAHMQDILGSDFGRPMADEEPRFPPTLRQLRQGANERSLVKEEASEEADEAKQQS